MRRLLIGAMLLVLGVMLVFSPAQAAGWTAEVTRLDLLAGPGGTAAFLAPDGSRFAYFDANELCFYTLDGVKQDCFNFEGTDLRLDRETPRWSPDSTKLAFAEPFLVTFRDSDIWVFDSTTGKLTDMSNDPTRGEKMPLGEDAAAENLTVDLAPQWSSDSHFVYFVRYTFKQVREARADIYRLNVNTGDTEEVARIASNIPFSTYAFALAPDDTRIVYNLDTRGEERDGTWFLDLTDSRDRFAGAPVEDTFPTAYQFSADGTQLLVNGASLRVLAGKAANPEHSPVYTLPASGGRQQSLDTQHHVYNAGWVANSTALVYTTFNPREPDSDGLFVAPAPGEAGDMVLPGRFVAPTGQNRLPLLWAANNTLLLSEGPDFKLVVVRLTQE